VATPLRLRFSHSLPTRSAPLGFPGARSLFSWLLVVPVCTCALARTTLTLPALLLEVVTLCIRIRAPKRRYVTLLYTSERGRLVVVGARVKH